MIFERGHRVVHFWSESLDESIITLHGRSQVSQNQLSMLWSDIMQGIVIIM